MENRKLIKKQTERKVEHFVKKGFKIFFFILLGLAIAFLVGYILMRLWNWLVPDIFGLAHINHWQAIGILVLAKIIFGFGGSGGPGKRKTKRKYANRCGPFRRDFTEWEHYDAFWKEEGETAYKNYIAKIESGEKSNTDNQSD